MISKKLLILLGFTIFFSLVVLTLNIPTNFADPTQGVKTGFIFDLIVYGISVYGLAGCILIWIAIGVGKLFRKLNKNYSIKTSVAIIAMIIFASSFSIYSYFGTCGFFTSSQSPDFCIYFY